MGGSDGLDQNLVAPQRGEVTDGTIDPVPDELDPTVTGACLTHHLGRQLRFVVQVDRQARDVPLRCCDVLTCANDPRQIERSSMNLVSTGDPASRSNSTPASRSVFACPSKPSTVSPPPPP